MHPDAICPAASAHYRKERAHTFEERTRRVGRGSTTIRSYSDCIWCGAARLVIGTPKEPQQ